MIGKLHLADARHDPRREVRRRPVPDDRPRPLLGRQGVHEREPVRLLVLKRAEGPVGRGHGPEHARRARDVVAGHGEVQHHVVPG